MKISLRNLKRLGVRLSVPMAMLLAVAVLAAVRPGWLGGRLLRLSQSASDGRLTVEPPVAESVPEPGKNGEPVDGNALVVAALDRLTYGPSLTARLHQRIRNAGGDVFGVGAYWQEAFQRGGRFKLELRTKTSHLRVVGDGDYVWRQVAIEGEQRITRIDLKHSARLAGVPAARVRTPFDPRAQHERSVAPISLGGLPRLLQSLARTYRFHRPRPAVLSDVPVLELRGALDGPSNERESVGSPPQVPSHVIVSLGQDDLFPYRVVYEWKAASPEQHESGVPTRVEILFFDVNQGPSIDSRHFEYSRPRDAGWEDITAETAAASEPRAMLDVPAIQ